MRSRTGLWAPLAVSITLLAAACADKTEPPRATATGAESPRAVDTGAEPAPEDLKDLKGPDGLPEPEMDLTDVFALLREEVGFADTRHRADVRGEEAIRLVASGGGAPLPSGWFQPAILVGDPGQSLTLVLSNPDPRLGHTFTVPDLNIDVSLPNAKDEKAVQVTFPKGDQPTLFFCELHRDYGQVGALVASS
jgi:hypothetical protein